MVQETPVVATDVLFGTDRSPLVNNSHVAVEILNRVNVGGESAREAALRSVLAPIMIRSYPEAVSVRHSSIAVWRRSSRTNTELSLRDCRASVRRSGALIHCRYTNTRSPTTRCRRAAGRNLVCCGRDHQFLGRGPKSGPSASRCSPNGRDRFRTPQDAISAVVSYHYCQFSEIQSGVGSRASMSSARRSRLRPATNTTPSSVS